MTFCLLSDIQRESTEREEFLPHKSDGGKQPQFTDVSEEIKFFCLREANFFSCFSPDICFFSVSLKERPPLECLYLTSAMPSWAVGFWDCPMPCPTLVSSFSCE